MKEPYELTAEALADEYMPAIERLLEITQEQRQLCEQITARAGSVWRHNLSASPGSGVTVPWTAREMGCIRRLMTPALELLEAHAKPEEA